MAKPEIKLTGCQVKSIEKARVLAAALHVIETECGIKETWIRLEGCFICPDITDEELDTLNQTAMERNVRSIIQQIRAHLKT